MPNTNRLSSRAAHVLFAIAFALPGCSSLAGAPPQPSSPAGSIGAAPIGRSTKAFKDLYIGNIGGGVLLYSTGKAPREVGDIVDQLPRVTGVWVDQKGVLYAYSDNRSAPYETIEEFQPGSNSPFFSLVVQRYGGLVAADAQQNVYAQGENTQGDQVIDVYPPASQQYANEYIVPTLGLESAIESLTFDSTGTLLVGLVEVAHNLQGEVGGVLRFDASSSGFVNLNLKKVPGGLIATDNAGNLYAGGNERISVYPSGATSPSRIIRTKSPIVTLTAAADGTLYVGTSGGVSVYRPGKQQPTESLTPEAQVSGLSLGPR